MSEKRSAGSLYRELKRGMAQTAIRGGKSGSSDKMIGLLAVDKDVWMKVYNSEYRSKLVAKYNKHIKGRGNHLNLIEKNSQGKDLNDNAERAMYSIKDKAKKI